MHQIYNSIITYIQNLCAKLVINSLITKHFLKKIIKKCKIDTGAA